MRLSTVSPHVGQLVFKTVIPDNEPVFAPGNQRTCPGSCMGKPFLLVRGVPKTLRDKKRLEHLSLRCTTNGRPYDFAVMAALIVAKHHLGDKILIQSDCPDMYWGTARCICEIVLGYGDRYHLGERGLTADTTRTAELDESFAYLM